MMRSLYSGVAGLRTHQTKMDVIGNNIANVNTTAYKASSIVFSDLMSQTTQRASGPNATTGAGGVNARQIGLGVKSGAININITGQGSTQSTGNPFDVMINGENFFVVNNGQENFFTRDGSFYVDAAGNLAMTSLGYTVMGWQVNEETGKIQKDTVSALRIMSAANMTYPPEATSEAYMSGIIDKNDTDVTSENGRVVNLNFFDSLGYSYTAKFTFRQSTTQNKNDKNEYSLELDKILDSTGEELELTEEQKRALFGDSGGGMATQQVNTKVSLKKGYTWNTASDQLSNADGVIANLADIFDNTGNIKSGDTAAAPADPKYPEETVGERAQRELDALAAAYGYEGSTEDFLNLCVGFENAATPPVVEHWSVQQLLVSQVTNALPSPATGATGDTLTAVKKFSDLGGGAFNSDSRVYYGHTVTFDAKTGLLQSVDGLTTDFTVRLNLNSAGLGGTTANGQPVTDENNPMGNFSNINIDLSEISMFDNKGTSTIGATSGSNDEQTLGMGAGRRLGDMIGVSIDKSGLIYASYDNGMTRLLGQIATAAFANASGLEKQGDNLYSATLNSGEFDGIGEDITANGGYLSTGQLEMSNVDLSSEFTEMITTQRGFQANSRIITVSDTLLEELTNLKR